MLQKMYKVVKVKHITTLPPWKFVQAIPYSEAILDTVKWTFVARNFHEYSLSVITCIQHTLTALKVVVLLQINSNYNIMSAKCTVREYNLPLITLIHKPYLPIHNCQLKSQHTEPFQVGDNNIVHTRA